MSIQLAYRMTVYAGIYSDDTDVSVLSPVAGAPHSDGFKVSTIQGVSGFQPYMNPPRGKRGSLKVPEQKLEVGNYTVTLLDKRTGSGNINRWVTAFFGNSQGKFTLIGKKAYIEESTDNGATWSPFFVGQISDVDLNSQTQVSITIKDNVMFLKEPMFRTHPRVDYSVYNGLVPVGLTKNITNENNDVVLPRPEGLEASIIGKTESLIGTEINVTISSRSRNIERNLWPFETQFAGGNTGVTEYWFWNNFPVRALVEVSGTPYIFGVTRVFTPRTSNSTNARPPIDVIHLWPLAPWEEGAASPDVIPTGTNITNVRIWLFKYEEVADKNGFWLIEDWDTIVADALDGKFYEPVSLSGLTVNISRKTPYDLSNLTAVMNERNIPRPSFFINKSITGLEFLEQYAFAPYSVGYTMEPVEVAGVPLCRLRVYSTAQPTSVSGLVTINGTDVEAKMPEWNIEQPVSAVSIKYYEEYETRITKNSNDGAQTELKPTTQVEHTFGLGNSTDGNIVLNNDIKKIELTANGIRAFVPTDRQRNNYYGIEPQEYTRTRANEAATTIFNRFKGGISTVLLRTLRNTKTNGVDVGDFVLVEVEVLPNQATHTRGGTRLMQVLNKYAVGVRWEMELLDSGVNVAMAAPTVGTPTSSDKAQIEVAITTTERAMVEVQYASTETGASQPTDDSGFWTFAKQELVNNTTSTIEVAGLPEGRRIWVRARCVSPPDGGLKLNSQWVVGGSVVLSNIATPSSVSVDRITSRGARVQWTNTDTTLPIEVWLASPAATPDTKIVQLPAGSTSYVLRGLDRNSSTSHRVGVRYYDQYQGNGAFATADFTATGTPPTLDAPAAILLYASR